MSIEVMSAVWRESASTGRARLVLLAIADHQGEIGAWPSIATLARMVNASERSVQRDIQELEALGELEVHVQQAPSRGQYKANLYWVTLPSLSGVTNQASGVTKTASGVTNNASGVTARGVLTLKEPLENPNRNLVQDELERAFEKFWSSYPRRHGKGKARESFVKAYKLEGYKVIEGAIRYANDPNLPSEEQYIPLPATWLNQERWNDDPLPYREPTAEEIAERNYAQFQRRREADLEASRQLREEMAKAREAALANPPRYCEHDRVLVMCATCGPKL